MCTSFNIGSLEIHPTCLVQAAVVQDKEMYFAFFLYLTILYKERKVISFDNRSEDIVTKEMLKFSDETIYNFKLFLYVCVK